MSLKGKWTRFKAHRTEDDWLAGGERKKYSFSAIATEVNLT